jgi:hypothetical protein
MNPSPGQFAVEHLPFPNEFDVCWAGANPLSAGLCFGSTDGKVMFANQQGLPTRIGEGSASGAAINGVARAGVWIGVSTRQEVNFYSAEEKQSGFVPFGAHEIRAEGRYLIAPLGRNGIMVMDPPHQAKALIEPKMGLYAYRLATTRSQSGTVILACAARSGGIFTGTFIGPQTMTLKMATFPGFDAVDICPLDPGSDSRGFAALGKDGTLVLFRDVLANTTNSITMKFKSVQGVAYRMLCSYGDIHLLTSKGWYVLGELAGRFLRGELVKGVTTPVTVTPMEVVDANLVDYRWLLVVVPGAVVRIDLADVHRQVLAKIGDAEGQESPETNGGNWQRKDVETTTRELAGAAPSP